MKYRERVRKKCQWTTVKFENQLSFFQLFLCGIITLAVTEFKKLPHNRLKENYFTFLQINCAILLICTIFCCLLALIYGALHFATLATPDKECLPENLALASKSCICLFGERRNSSSTHLSQKTAIEEAVPGAAGFEIHYRDLTCDEVLGSWQHVILCLMVLNSLGLLAAVIFSIIFIIGSKNRSRRNYTSVRMAHGPPTLTS